MDRRRRAASSFRDVLNSLLPFALFQLEELNGKTLYRHPDDYDWDGDLDAPDCDVVMTEVGGLFKQECWLAKL